LWSRKAYEPMPTSLGAFKNHPSFVLEQHLKRDEALLPGTKEVGKLKGSEPVYPRSAVVHVKSSENWYRIGRIVGEEEEPMKYVKQRNATINKARIEAAALIEGNAPTQQGLFAESQTQVYVPPPVVDVSHTCESRG
jgi:xeroderma pigmentosum group C-complementing protein